MIDCRSRGAHRAPVRWLWFSQIRLLLHLRDLTQFVPSANQICKRARPRGSWFPLISTLLWSFSGRGWKARPSLVAQLGGLLCFLRRLNYSTTEISPLARFFSTPTFFILFSRRIDYKERISMLALTWHHAEQEQRPTARKSHWKCEYRKRFS